MRYENLRNEDRRSGPASDGTGEVVVLIKALNSMLQQEASDRCFLSNNVPSVQKRKLNTLAAWVFRRCPCASIGLESLSAFGSSFH
jgi:hypothetical protein